MSKKIPGIMPPCEGSGGGFVLQSLASVIALRKYRMARTSPVRAACRLVSAVWIIILVSLSHNLMFVHLLLAAYVVYLCFQKTELLRRLILPPVCAACLSALVLVPSLLFSPHSLAAVSIKVFISVGLITACSVRDGMRGLPAALALLRVPDSIILLLCITINSLSALAITAEGLLSALSLRYMGRVKTGRSALTACAGILFIKSVQFSAEMYRAMVLRGFGENFRGHTKGLQLMPVIYTVLSMAAAFGIYLFLN